MSINLSALQKQRRDTAANWTAENPTLLAGEIGLESDTGYWKVGDGATAWTSLAYVSGLGAEIPVNRLADGAARQLLQTDAAGTGVEWTDNVDVPGTLDVTGAGTFDGNVTIAGDLTVNGTTTTINTQDLLVEDKNIIIGNVTTPSDVTADGGGITLKGTTDKTINWVDATDAWTLSEHVDLASGKEYRINGTKVLDATSLGSGVLITSANITDGTIVDADVNASAAIAGTKISPDFGAQNVTTTGTNTAASFTPTSSTVPTNGVYLPAANSVALSTNGTGRVFIDSNGKVGVNNSTPGSYSSPGNTLVVGGHSSGNGITIAGGTTNTGYINFADGTAGTDSYTGQVFYSFGDNALGFATNGGTERMRLDSSGRLGIGTSTPSSLLTLNAASNPALEIDVSGTKYANLLVDTGSSATFLESFDGYPLAFSVSAGGGRSEKARLDTSGRLLVGTSSSATVGIAQYSKVQVKGNTFSSNEWGSLALMRDSAATTGLTAGTYLGGITFADSVGAEFASIISAVDAATGSNDYPGRLVFSTTADGASSPTEHMRINNVGEVRCFSNNNTSTIELRNASSSGTASRLLYGLHSATDNTNGTAIYSIFTNGTTGTPSDIRLKKNVESTRDGYLDDIANLRVVKYHWKTQDDAEPKELGLIAQEVEEVFPGLIHTEGEGDSEVKEIKRSVIPFILLKALQEADAKIEAQQVVINDLLARVAALESA